VDGGHFTFVSVPGVPSRDRHGGRVAEIFGARHYAPMVYRVWCLQCQGWYSSDCFCYWKGEKEGKMCGVNCMYPLRKMLGKKCQGVTSVKSMYHLERSVKHNAIQNKLVEIM
jgi:hypothetical protein